jgi:hypothetical protein
MHQFLNHPSSGHANEPLRGDLVPAGDKFVHPWDVLTNRLARRAN